MAPSFDETVDVRNVASVIKRNLQEFLWINTNLNDLIIFSCWVSGRCSSVKHANTEVNKGNNLVQSGEKVLATSGYTNYAKNLPKPGAKTVPLITCEVSAITWNTDLNNPNT